MPAEGAAGATGAVPANEDADEPPNGVAVDGGGPIIGGAMGAAVAAGAVTDAGTVGGWLAIGGGGGTAGAGLFVAAVTGSGAGLEANGGAEPPLDNDDPDLGAISDAGLVIAAGDNDAGLTDGDEACPPPRPKPPNEDPVPPPAGAPPPAPAPDIGRADGVPAEGF
ncbi:hypothetical protein [Mycobacteroides salmoniphilum]|uniref:hypothetical protein n=1 Tax=Mycobacteroides salmoniphilum TaxID=404941 RepID=UPI0010667F6C|nr:hypothetical protein [Mycobacteroides salmoniphilum]